MLDFVELRQQHQSILRRATSLIGLADAIKTREDAQAARSVIEGLDRMLTDHLTIEDEQLYPVMLNYPDPEVRALAADCFEEMGGILGAWQAYRDQWTAATIGHYVVRFRAATAGLFGALAMRVDRENTEIYPIMEALADKGMAVA